MGGRRDGFEGGADARMRCGGKAPPRPRRAKASGRAGVRSGTADGEAKERQGGAAGKMFDDQDLGFFANFLGIFIFVLVIAYHFVMADPKYEGN